MTTKEIAEAAGVSVDTATRSIKSLYPEKMTQGKRVALTQVEAIAVMKDIRKVNFVQLPQDAEVPPQDAEVSSLDVAFKAAMVTLVSMAQSMDARLTKIETRIDQRQALLPPPQVKPRDHINMIVRKYVSETESTYPQAWNELYRQFSYRTNTNPATCAKNREMSILDYIETEGMIELLESVALEIFS